MNKLNTIQRLEDLEVDFMSPDGDTTYVSSIKYLRNYQDFKDFFLQEQNRLIDEVLKLPEMQEEKYKSPKFSDQVIEDARNLLRAELVSSIEELRENL